MKKIILTLTALLTLTVAAHAMSYEQARNEALFLTDKMAYELNLTDAQYEAAYEINLDYLMGVTSVDDVYGTYWERRNLDLSYILYNWQWEAFRAATYFYRPLYWDAGFWHFGVYARYPHRDYFYFGRPHFYATYRGGHAWHFNGGHSYYYGRASHFRPALPNGRAHFGMRNSFDRGDYRGSRAGSSTRVTGRREGYYGGNTGTINRGDRSNSGYTNRDNRNAGRSAYGNSQSGNFNRSSYRGSGSSDNDMYNHSGSSSSGYNRSTTGGSSYNRGGSGNFNHSSSGAQRSVGVQPTGGTQRSTDASRSVGGSSSGSSIGSHHSGGHSAGNGNSGGHFGRVQR